ncbi:MAG: hypothetical protein ACLFS1_09635 [Opitutales bacterium]
MHGTTPARYASTATPRSALLQQALDTPSTLKTHNETLAKAAGYGHRTP